ncbi:MAG TPA: pyridoxal phosphate-dependent aminotransferase [Gammaproteobacteria bacterium]|nr:pyridoxal phosphate-dependent aminotransferase [Gammaproteobacteria bacterium]
MTLQIADRVRTMTPSPTSSLAARTSALRAAGQDIIGMGTGELDYDTPLHIRQAAKDAIDRGFTRYTPVDGTPELKQAIIHKFARENQLEYRMTEVMASSGCKQTLYNLAQAVLNAGDEVIIPAPYWVSYPDIVRLAGGVPVFIPTGIDQGFKITARQLEAAITAKSRLIFINSPSNPSGSHYTPDELAELGGILLRHPNIIVATDDIYEHMLWRDTPFQNILNICPGLYPRGIVLNGVSKAYAMTGWRIGYAAGPELLIQKMKTIQSQSTSNPCSISQHAAVAALEGDQSFISEIVNTLKERHDFVYKALQNIDGIRCLPSQGTFYIFPEVQALMSHMGISSDVEFSEFLIDKAGVAVVPGSAFGAPGHIRLSFATNQENLARAMANLQQALS